MAERKPWRNPLAEPVHRVMFAGQPTPGIAEVRGASSPRRWDERESYGWSGAFVVYHGLKLSHFSVAVKLYTELDWEAWHAFQPLVQKMPLGKRQRPVDISHPFLQMLGIHSVVVEDVTQPEQVEDGVFEIEIKLIEYRSPRLALAAAEATKAEAADPEDERLDSLEKQVGSAGEEVERLEGGGA